MNFAPERPIRDHSRGGVNSGDRFEALTAVRAERQPRSNGQRRWVWLCRCDCGVEVWIPVGNLQSGNSKSCGCAKSARIASARTKHGHSKRGTVTREYVSWSAMIVRCYTPTNHKYPEYGGRGIAVCNRWRNDFAAFLADMRRRPPNTTLDRFPDNDGNYEPGNCRWATPLQQRLNQRPRRKHKERSQ